jgi:hypothetical protein
MTSCLPGTIGEHVSLFKSSYLLVIFHVFLSQVAQTFIDIPNIKTSYNITYLDENPFSSLLLGVFFLKSLYSLLP